MDQRTIQILFTLLRSAICKAKLTEQERNLYSSDLLSDLLKISSGHDVAHLLALGLKQNKLLSKEHCDIEQYIFKAVYRYERSNYEYENLCAALEKAQIPFLPLKGSVIRQYYPESWMRTSCDIDILVHEEDCEKVRSVLGDEYGYVYHGKGSHNLSLFSPANVHIELHYDLVEDGIANKSSEVLKNVWDMAVVRDGYAFWYEMPDEYYYFYHIAHMAKHIENGGCGIRPFIDLWVLNHNMTYDAKKREAILKRGELLKFAKNAERLSEVWFGGQEHTEATRRTEMYIIRGGVYGASGNRIAVQQNQKGGKIKYVISKIFIPYDVIKFYYPLLGKYKIFTPIMEVCRWCRLIFCGHLGRVTKELEYNAGLSKCKVDGVKKLLEDMGLEK